MTSPSLMSFSGDWRLERRISDRLRGEVLRFAGRAFFVPVEAGVLELMESGVLRLPGGSVLTAERRYFWRGEERGIAVSFGDGRPFHHFDPSASAPEGSHDCSPDVYRVAYDFSRWPRWRVAWQVRGPRKAYLSVSCFSRIS